MLKKSTNDKDDLSYVRFRFLEFERSSVESAFSSARETIHTGSGRGMEQNLGLGIFEDISDLRFLKDETIERARKT